MLFFCLKYVRLLFSVITITDSVSKFSSAIHKQLRAKLSQAAACDGTLITTSAENQEIVPGTLPTF